MSKESATSRGVLGSSMTSPIVFAKLFCVFAPDFSCRICCRHRLLSAALALARIHRRTRLDGVRTAEGEERELQGRWPGFHWDRLEVGGRSSVAGQGPCGRLRELRAAWRENTQQGTPADRGGASFR